MDTEALQNLDSTSDILGALNDLTIAIRRRIIKLEGQLPYDLPYNSGPRPLRDMGIDVDDIRDESSIDKLRAALVAVHHWTLAKKGQQ